MIARWKTLFSNLFLAACIAGCAAPATPAPTPTATATTAPTATAVPTATKIPPTPTTPYRELVVYPDQELQTVREVGGGNFIHYFGQSHAAFEPVSTFNWQMLSPRVIRVGMELETWEADNDDPDPLNFAMDGFIDAPGDYNHATFEMLRQAKAAGVTVVASIWRVPGWLVENPTDESGQIIPRSLYPEAVESIAAWLLRAKNEYGVDVDYVSFNEANLGIRVLLTPFDVIELLRLAGPRFAELGLETRWLLGDTSNMAEAADYAGWIWQAKDIRPYLGPLAFHSWDAGAADSTLERIGKLADENGLEVWCTEGGWDPSLWQNPERFPTWTHATSLAAVYTRALKMTRATVFQYWQMSGNDYAINDGSQPYPALVFISAFQRAFPAGAVVLKTSPDKGGIKFTAARAGAKYSVIVVNVSVRETMTLRGLPDGNYDVHIYSQKSGADSAHTLAVIDGAAVVDLEGFSITFVTSAE
jgi:O-glycosyl hydrolase